MNNSPKLKEIIVINDGELFEIRVIFDNDIHHSVYLDKGARIDKVRAMLHLLGGNISYDPELR